MSDVVECTADVHPLVVLLDRTEVEAAAHLIDHAPGTVVTNLYLSASSLKHATTETFRLTCAP